MRSILLFFFVLFTSSIYSQISEDLYIKPGYETVFGKNYIYQLKTPSGYQPKIQTVSLYEGHIKYTPKVSTYKPFEFYIIDKFSTETADAVGYISNYYKMKYDKLSVFNINVKNFPYECVAKMYSVDQQFYDYIFYINCGERFKYWIIANLHSEKRPLNQNEIDVFYNTMLSLNPIR